MLIAIIAGLLASSGQDGGPVIVNPRWLEPPSTDFAEDSMPDFARTVGIAGRVVLKCMVLRPGPPVRCHVVESSAPGLGFEQAALLTASTGRVEPQTVDGVARPASVQFAVNFAAYSDEPDQPAVSVYTGPAPSPGALALGRRIAERDFDHFVDLNDVYALSDLAPERRDTVRAWCEELLPLNRELAVTNLGLMLARLYDEADLQDHWDNRTPFKSPPDWEDLERVSADLVDTHRDAALAELRRRYCSAYECGTLP